MKTRQMAALENNLQAEAARVNGVPGDWRKTAIAETETSVLTDPLNSRYWRGSFDQVRHFPIPDDRQRRARGIVRGLERIASRQNAHRRGRRSYATDGVVKEIVSRFMRPGDNAMAAVNGLRTLASRQKSSETFQRWNELRLYAAKLGPGARVRDMNQRMLRSTLTELVQNQI